jgi:membrane associated rhomboid family serine protease
MGIQWDRVKQSILISIFFLVLLWFVKVFEITFHIDLAILGIFPRTFQGTAGILFGPLIHGDIPHLLSNTVPLLILLFALFYLHNKIAFEVFTTIYILTGFWVWLTAREAYHIGASGLIYGFVAYLIIAGIRTRDLKSIAAALIVVIMYGGMVHGVLPFKSGISWESHILGCLSGIFSSVYYKVPEPVMVTLTDENPLQLPDTKNLPGPDRFENHTPAA